MTKDKIFNEVLSSPFSPKALIILNTSKAIWEVDVSNYLTKYFDHNNFYRHSAYLALFGIINL